MLHRVPRPKPLPPELGRLDFELYVMEGFGQLNKTLDTMTGEMQRNAPEVEAEGVRLAKYRDSPIQVRRGR